jgi:hypothetical protein
VSALDFAAEDFELIDCASGEKFSGPEGARRNAEGWLIPFSDVNVELLNVVSAGDWAIAEAVGRATHSGPLQTPMGEVPATGKEMEPTSAPLIRVRDGKIVEGRDYYDATIANQLRPMLRAGREHCLTTTPPRSATKHGQGLRLKGGYRSVTRAKA